MVKVNSNQETRGEVIQIVNLFRANIVDVGAQSMVIEITGEEDKINALCALLEPFGILEMLRTGRVAMVRGRSNGQVSDNVGLNSNGNGNSPL